MKAFTTFQWEARKVGSIMVGVNADKDGYRAAKCLRLKQIIQDTKKSARTGKAHKKAYNVYAPDTDMGTLLQIAHAKPTNAKQRKAENERLQAYRLKAEKLLLTQEAEAYVERQMKKFK